ncbi:MAG: AI-2E family transporter [Hyphomicrobiales bacterium]
MADKETNKERTDELVSLSLDIGVRLAILGFIAYWCALLMAPFFLVVIWAAVLATALFPFYEWLKSKFGGRGGLAATLISIAGILLIAGPVSALGLAVVDNLTHLSDDLAANRIRIPPPPSGVADWPFFGDWLARTWSLASQNLDATLQQFKPQIKSFGGWLLGMFANTGLGVLQFFASMIIAGIFFGSATSLTETMSKLVHRLFPGKGEEFVALAGATIRNVSRGVVGISIGQALLAGVGLLAAGIPFAGLLTFFCLVLAIIQIGPGLVLFPAIIYAWWSMDTLPALLFTIWTVPVAIMDGFLKPVVMSRGLSVPMLVIFLGVIGGTIAHGILGLFIGPVILSVGYQMITAWLGQGVKIEEFVEEEKSTDSGNP